MDFTALRLVCCVDRPELRGDAPHIGETVSSVGILKLRAVATQVRRPQRHPEGVNVSTRGAFTDRVVWLEGSNTDLRVSLPRHGALVDVGRPDDDVIVVNNHQLGVDVYWMSESVADCISSCVWQCVLQTIRNILRTFSLTQT